MPSGDELADFVVKKAADDPELAERVREARVLAPFVDDLAWQALRKKFEDKKETLLVSIARRLMRADKVDQSEIDFQRGYFKGIEEFLAEPDRVINTLEAAARMAYVAAGEDEYIPE